MLTKVLLLSSFVFCGTVLSNDVPQFYDPKSYVWGKKVVRGTVQFHTDKYDLQSCERQKDPKMRRGFHVIQIDGTKTLVVQCGVQRHAGDKVNVIFDEGI